MSNTTYILYQNLLMLGTVTASSEDVNYPVENSFDGFTNTFYRTAVSGAVEILLELTSSYDCDYFAIFNTDGGSYSATYKLQYWTGSVWADCFTATAVTGTTPQAKLFTSVNSTKFKVILDATDVTNWCNISFGKRLQMPYGQYIGFTPPQQNKNDTILNSISQNGTFVGRSILRKGINATFEFVGLTFAFIRSEWTNFIEYAEKYPFYVIWNYETYPDETAYLWTAGNIENPVISNYGYYTVSLNCNGRFN